MSENAKNGSNFLSTKSLSKIEKVFRHESESACRAFLEAIFTNQIKRGY